MGVSGAFPHPALRGRRTALLRESAQAPGTFSHAGEVEGKAALTWAAIHPISGYQTLPELSVTQSDIAREVARRRTFAIISHPDAGKTTLTEKLLLFGGAIQLAGQVRAKGDRRRTRSDWMSIERARGISVVTSVMTFEYEGCVFNLLDTPGHEDFSEDTYRTLTAVDAAVMVIDAAKGIEARTRKLFEICRLRDIPIITFVNKMDREAREPLDLLDEIEKALALTTAPMVWPIGRGRDFAGTYDLMTPRVRRLEQDPAGLPVSGPDDPALDDILPAEQLQGWREELNLVQRSLPSVRSRRLSRRPSDAGLFRVGAEKFRRARSSRCAHRLRAAAARPGGVIARRACDRRQDDRHRVQDPGEHGSQSPRPHRLHAPGLGAIDARHEGQDRAHRQADDLVGAAVLLRAGSLDCG